MGSADCAMSGFAEMTEEKEVIDHDGPRWEETQGRH